MTVKTLCSLFLGLAFTTACSEQADNFKNTLTDSSAIVGGSAVSTSDPISKSTALLLGLKVKKFAGGSYITGYSICTATLISNSIVLTAGHCSASNPRTTFLVFSNQIPSDWESFINSLPNNPLARQVVAGVTAPAWKALKDRQMTNWGDIALLRFVGDMPKGYTPAKLASKNLGLKSNQTLTLAGYGLIDGVNKTSAKQLMKAPVNIADVNFSETEMKMDNTNGRTACHGDSGGPAYARTALGSSVLAGITSRSDIMTDPNSKCIGKTIYTKVQPYLGWISSEMNKLNTIPGYGVVIAQPYEEVILQ